MGKQYLSYGVTCNIFDTLVSWDADNNVIPMLATEWGFWMRTPSSSSSGRA